MTNANDQTLRQLDALNSWLSDVYSEGMDFSTLLSTAGFSGSEIEHIKRVHLREFLQAVIALLATYRDLHNEHRDILMVQHYGLIDGKPQDLYQMGSRYGVCGERMRQLVHKRLVLFQASDRQSQLQADFAVIGRRLLDDESDSKV